MKKPSLLIVLIALSILLSLTACERSASKAPVPTDSNLMPFPTPAGDTAMTAFMTQTAAAKGGVTVPTQPGAVLPTNTIPPQPTAVPPTATPVPTMIPVPSATPGLPATWILQQGEHPYCIARRFNIHPADLLEANNLSADARPDEGTELKIPANAAPWPGATRSLMAHPDRWTVDPGDTVYKIACAYGDVDPNAIIYANGLQAPYTLEVGQVLNIP